MAGPTAGVRRGLGFQRAGHHAAWQDGLGNLIRPGEVVFNVVSYKWKVKGKMREGAAPARIFRIFYDIEEEEEGDVHGMRPWGHRRCVCSTASGYVILTYSATRNLSEWRVLPCIFYLCRAS